MLYRNEKIAFSGVKYNFHHHSKINFIMIVANIWLCVYVFIWKPEGWCLE